MLYVGHFSFFKGAAPGSAADEPCHGYFTTIAEAESIDEAIAKFRTLIRTLHDDDEVLSGVHEVFLDACVECRSVPQSGFLAHFVEWSGEETAKISTAIRGATDDEAVAYYIGSGNDSDDDEKHEVEPFVVFDD